MPIARSAVLWGHVITSVIANLVSLVLVVLVASSILDYVYLDTIPSRTALYGLLAVALVALALP